MHGGLGPHVKNVFEFKVRILTLTSELESIPTHVALILVHRVTCIAHCLHVFTHPSVSLWCCDSVRSRLPLIYFHFLNHSSDECKNPMDFFVFGQGAAMKHTMDTTLSASKPSSCLFVCGLKNTPVIHFTFFYNVQSNKLKFNTVSSVS